MAAAKPTREDPPKVRFYRRRSDQQLGFMIEQHGREMIKLDRPAHDEVEPFNANKWDPVSTDRPVNRQQVARLAFDADRSLCRMLALHGDARKEWVSLSDKDRIAWIANGPPADPPIRRRIYLAIMAEFPDQAP